MTKPMIEARNLGKCYRIHHQGREDKLRHALAAGLRRLLRGEATNGDEDFWALREVSFQVGEGEIVGVIGANGAGKSTLLKILSRITEPSEGEAVLRGRVSSLLEVGTGFHPELTGRENIFMNGSILGMTRREIQAKFDAIVDFADVQAFLDTPVKRYSSGMTVRLAFAVAAHLEPEILLIDEVLAVGDAAFQKRCLGKMNEVARGGRTVLFVSHNMLAVQDLCHSVIWLDRGIIAAGEPAAVVGRYLGDEGKATTEVCWQTPGEAPGNACVRLHRAGVRPENGTNRPLTVDTPILLEFQYWHLTPNKPVNLRIALFNSNNIEVFVSGSRPYQPPRDGGKPPPSSPPLLATTCRIPADLLNDGAYTVRLMVVHNGSAIVYRQDEIVSFRIGDTGRDREGWYNKWPGIVRPRLQWSTRCVR